MKRLSLCLLLMFGFLFSNSSWAYEGLTEKYTENLQPKLAIGANYSLYTGDRMFSSNHESAIFGNAVDAALEFFVTPFLSFHFGYQYMNYGWRERHKSDSLTSQKALQGIRLYFGGFFVHGGAYELWTFRDIGNKEVKGFAVGPFIGLGYSTAILKDLLELETGARFYFYPDKESRNHLSMSYISINDSFSWDWYIGLKVFVF